MLVNDQRQDFIVLTVRLRMCHLHICHFDYFELKVLKKPLVQEELSDSFIPLKAGESSPPCTSGVEGILITENLGPGRRYKQILLIFHCLLCLAQISLLCQFFTNVLFLHVKAFYSGHVLDSVS